MEMTEVMRAELRVDCYDGPSCDQHRKYWNAYAEGDMQDDDMSEKELTLNLDHFPPGTKVVVTVPECPECDMDVESCDCGFDWKNWVAEQYS